MKYIPDYRQFVNEAVNLKAAHLSSAEYQKAKKLKAFDSADWTWNPKSQLYDKVNESLVTEAKFFRLPNKLNAMWELKNSVDYIVGKHSNGDDYNPAEMKTIEEFIKKIKKSAKAFKDSDEVKGTIYESVNEAKEEPIIALLKLGMFAAKGTGEKKLLRLSDDFEEIGDEQADEIASHLNMAIELFQDGYSKDAVSHFKKFNKACKDELALMKKQGLAESLVTEAKRAGLSKKETLKVAQKFAKALSKVDGVKVTVSKGHEEDSFDLDYDGEEYDGGSYNINDDGSVVNMAVRHPKTKVSPTYGNINDDVATIVKTIKKLPKMLGEGTVIDLRLVNENVNDEIEMALMNWLNTLADGDAVNMSDLYLDNGILLGTVAKEIKQGREQIQEYFEMFLKKSPIGSIDTFILQNFGDVCISDGTYTFEIDGEGGNRESVAARYTYVWKKENEKWMIATHHSSVNPK